MPRPRIELSFRSFKLVAEETEAIGVVCWPLRILIFSIAVCLVVVVFKAHPIDWMFNIASWTLAFRASL
jgi:hypothetical protein